MCPIPIIAHCALRHPEPCLTVAVQLCTVIDRAISVTLGRGMAPCPRSSSALLACHRLVQDALLNPEHYLIRSGSELGHLVRLRSGQLTAGWPKVERQKLPTPRTRQWQSVPPRSCRLGDDYREQG